MLFVQLTTSANVTTGTEYAANYRLEDGTITMIHTDAGYYTPVPPPSGAGNPTYNHIWYLKDHLGNNRVLADASGTVYAVNDYDPFGNSMTSPITGTQPSFPAGMTASPYKYGGKEWNTTTSTYDFEARQMAPGFHRFTTMDPLCEKYYGISPYAYCANNPVNMVDPKGQDWVYDQEMQQYIWRDDVDSIDKTSAGFEYVGKDNTSILLHAGFITPVQTQRYTSNGFILNDFDFVHRASVQGESVVYVQVNTSYSEDAESETNRQGRVFTGLTVVANEIVDIISTADNTEATFQMAVMYNGERFDSQLTAPNYPVIASKGTSQSAIVTIPSDVVNKAQLFHYAGMTVSLSGMFGVKSYLGFSPMVSSILIPSVKRVQQTFSF